MNKLPVIGIFIAMLLIVSGYVSSSPNEEPPATLPDSTAWHMDAHVNYYEEHLAKLGIERR